MLLFSWIGTYFSNLYLGAAIAEKMFVRKRSDEEVKNSNSRRRANFLK